MNSMLESIKTALVQAEQTYIQNPVITLQQAIQDSSLVQRIIQVYGFVVINDVYTEQDMVYNYQYVIRELSLYLFNIENPHQNPVFEAEYQRIHVKYPKFLQTEKELATLTLWWNTTNGFGNCSFRFLFHQYVEANEATRFMINEKEIYFTWNPYHRIALRVMSRYPDLWNILKQQHPNKQVMLSWDSQKIRFHETGRNQSKNLTATKPVLTERHRDLYGDVERTQAMFIRDQPGAVHLGFVKFTNQPYIKSLIEQYMGVGKNGFSKIGDKPELSNILDKYWYPVINGFVIWSTDTFHYEGLQDATGGTGDKWSDSDMNNHLSIMSNRLATGVHVVYNLLLEEKLQLAVCSEYGFQPEIYGNRNANTMIDKNVVDKKTSQYKVARKKHAYETYTEQLCKQALSNDSGINYIKSLHPMYREMYGIYQ